MLVGAAPVHLSVDIVFHQYFRRCYFMCWMAMDCVHVVHETLDTLLLTLDIHCNVFQNICRTCLIVMF